MGDASGENSGKDKKRKKQYKRMGKILSAAWEWDAAFHDKSSDEVICLTDVGQKLDQKSYKLGRHGWEDFAKDLGGVYNWHINKKTSKASKASKCIEKATEMFSKVDESIAKLAAEYVPTAQNDKESRTTPKKRKADGNDDKDTSTKKKKSANKNSELAQREERAIEMLSTFIEDRGGDRSQVASYSARVTRKASNNKFDTNFYNEAGRRFRSMLEVGRFLGLVQDEKGGGGGRVRRAKGNRGATSRELEAEKKRIRKELEKLRKSHTRAVKALDDFVSDKKDNAYSMDDDNDVATSEAAMSTGPDVTPTVCAAARVPDIGGFPGIPDNCIPDILMSWNFLCTFERALNLTPIGLDDFVDALVYVPPEGQMGDDLMAPPVYLAEAHLALLKLLLEDRSSDDWWWSTLESSETNTQLNLNEDDETGPDAEPPIKFDISSLLSQSEDPLRTTSWLTSLESVTASSESSRKEFRGSLRGVLKLVSNKWVSAYLRKAMAFDKTTSCEFSRKACKWLCRRVREARPDLHGAVVKQDIVSKAKTKVIDDVAKLMEKLPESAPAVGDDEVSDTEYDDDSDDSDDDVEESLKDRASAMVDESQKVASPIPPKPSPTFVDMLLPPSKPKANDEFVNAFTWSHLVGAVVFRTFHRRKRLLNEVDDAIRDANHHGQLLVPERRDRERMIVSRVLTECVEDVDSGFAIEQAINHLCCGGSYIRLEPVERLCILRALIEAAYDSGRVNDVVIGNYKQRVSAMKALETEQRRAKKEAREKAAADEAGAREQLAAEAREQFLDEKREEIRQLNEKSKEFSDEVMESLTYEDIIEFDDDIKADYDALPGPDSFNKAEVTKMVVRLREEAAFDTDALRVIAMEELLQRERVELEEMEGQLLGFGGEDALDDPDLDRETLRSIERLQRDIARAKALAEKLPELREKALEQLKDAISDGTIKVLRSAVAAAKKAKLTGPDDETGGTWAVDVMRDAALELDKAKQNKRVFDAQKDLVAKRNRCFIRCDPLGQDRFWNRFWTFNAEAGGHIWIDTEYSLVEDAELETVKPGFVNLLRKGKDIQVGAADMETDFSSSSDTEDFLKFCRQEYHSTGFSSSLVRRHWGCHLTEESLRSVIKLLDNRQSAEDDLKAKLKDSLEEIVERDEAIAEEAEDEENGEADGDKHSLHVDGDEEPWKTAKASVESEVLENASDLLESLVSAIGADVRVRLPSSDAKDGSVARYENGRVVGWMLKKVLMDDAMMMAEEEEEDEEEKRQKTEEVPKWKVTTDRGKVVWCTGEDLVESVIRKSKYDNEAGYFESDSCFLAYRNSSGRHCGKASEAPYASSPIYLARAMVKRESELYPKLKIRSYDNTWGGKSGARNLWTNSMKDFAYDFSTVQQGLLTLEQAFFDLTLGFSEYKDPPDVSDVNAVLNDPVQRVEIELESIEKAVPGLWNSPLSRAVFIEIVKVSKTTGFLALALDLLCRNTMKYLQRHKLLNVRSERETSRVEPVTSGRRTRRMNAWQQKQKSYQEDDSDDDWE